ncbi:3-isopropylmalate dehydrogenase [Salinibacter ruber]|uniref:3-isopropylmalate dehydrogenase n=1 Tax=Salinibacter ruber TaxID=146919 RepID=UPI000E6D23D7|nr:3-isopropylmalate dehydrogenase [Salinibacter ruber]
MHNTRSYDIAWLPGDGIGPEVTREALRVLEAVGSAHGFSVTATEHRIGGAALDETGGPLPGSTREACLVSDAVLLGAVGGPQWNDNTGEQRPERGLLALRKALGVYANLRPVRVPEALAGASPLRPDRVGGTDILFVRELTGGIYFGTPEGRTGHGARSTMAYSEDEIERIAHVAFQRARRRGGHVTSVDKANVLEVSELWREVVTEVHDDCPDVTLRHLYVDNAAMQVVRDPRQFDVVLTGNLFGDILSDLAAALPGSLGLLPSASVGGTVGLFEPVHGSAPDIAGQDVANPTAAILSAALLLDEVGEHDAADAIRHGVDAALDASFRTADLAAADEEAASTSAFGREVATRAADSVPQNAPTP